MRRAAYDVEETPGKGRQAATEPKLVDALRMIREFAGQLAVMSNRQADVEKLLQETVHQLREQEQVSGALAQAAQHLRDVRLMDRSELSTDELEQRAYHRHRMWRCETCGSRLAFYNPETEVLHVAHKGLSLRTWGGGTEITCPSCLYVNKVGEAVNERAD